MELSPEGIVAYVANYIQSLPAQIMGGDVFALTITLIGSFVAIVVIHRLTGLLIVVLKKIILFLIVTLAFWQFITMFLYKVATDGWTTDTIIFGAAGFIVGFVAISVSLYVALRSFYEAQKEGATEAEVAGEPGSVAETVVQPAAPAPAGEAAVTVTPAIIPEAPAAPLFPPAGPAAAVAVPVPEPAEKKEGAISAMKDTLSVSSIKSDKNLGAVLAYLIIAQFGVFSSKTIPAPSFQVGVAFFLIFVVAGLFFIHFTYHNYLIGLRHLILAILLGFVIAFILGFFWGNIPLDQLLSPAFFQTDALVALVTGLALSLFMGGKG